jgi:hypothetical protein
VESNIAEFYSQHQKLLLFLELMAFLAASVHNARRPI